MPNVGEDTDYAERTAANADVHREAWARTIEEMQSRAEELREEGWDVVTVGAEHTAPVGPEAGETDRFGLVHVVPDNEAEAFSDAFDQGTYPEYQVYRQAVDGRLFLLTELRDPDAGTAIVVASNFELLYAAGLVEAAEAEGRMYTHVQTLDRTYLGSFRHDDWEKFFPDAERIKDGIR